MLERIKLRNRRGKDPYSRKTGKGIVFFVQSYTKEISTNALVTSGNKCGIVYHLFCVLTGEHFYTTNYYERLSLLHRFGWIDAGIEWKYPSVPQKNKENTILNPVYWIFNSFTTDYYYRFLQRKWPILMIFREISY